MESDRPQVSPRLIEMSQVVLETAVDLGLDPFPVNYRLATAQKVYEIGAYGLPGRYSHWTHGRAYHRMKTMYDYGLSKIYELVINSNPSEALLLQSNSDIQNILIMAHVLAHSDFFKNNIGFQGTNRQIVESAGLAADRLRRYEQTHGKLPVERFLDAVLAVEFNVGAQAPDVLDADDYVVKGRQRFLDKSKQTRTTDYDDLFNLGSKPKVKEPPKVPFPAEPEENILWFLANFSPKLQSEGIDAQWKRDVLEIVMNESIYFRPQMATKIMNEGWATFWHKRIMRKLGEAGHISDAEFIEWNKMNADVETPHQHELNPYWLGSLVWEDLEQKFQGDTQPNTRSERDWLGMDRPASHFKGKIDYDKFFVRENCPSDQAFLRNYLSDQVIKEANFVIQVGGTAEQPELTADPDVVRRAFVQARDNFGMPDVRVNIGGGDYKGNRELYLKHFTDRGGLDIPYAHKVLKYLYEIWGRPVHVETRNKEGVILISYTDLEKLEIKPLTIHPLAKFYS